MILQETDKYFTQAVNQPYLNILYKALFCAAYYGMLRVGELTKGPHVILAKNVHIGTNKRKLPFFLETSKTHDRSVKPQRIKITSSKNSEDKRKAVNKKPVEQKARKSSCPFWILQQFIKMRPPAQTLREQFFVFADNSDVYPHHLQQTMQLLLSNLGFDASLYNVHSMCIGRTSDLMHMGLSVETIKKLGRWKSNTVFTYLRD